MPKTVLKLNDTEMAKLALLGKPFHALPFFQEVQTKCRYRRIGPKERYETRDGLLTVMKNAHQGEPFRVLDAILADYCPCAPYAEYKFLYKASTGFDWENDDSYHRKSAWEEFYYGRFHDWCTENGFNGWQSYGNWPRHLAGWHHMQKYGQKKIARTRFRQYDGNCLTL